MLAFFSLIAIAFLAACGANDESKAPIESETENIKELVHEYSVGKISDQTASITSHQLIVTNSDDTQEIYALPADEFFVSIAPFITNTHP
ncbi:hypothetical protein GNT69_04480 [Bacillus sp. B15-48]|nr:hypothetical protein [Bacillus sp. B15-48]